MAIIGGKPVRIFIIGPMNESPDASGLPYEVHTENIKKAAEIVIAELDASYPGKIPFCEVIAPPDSPGDIVRAVFPHIFHCDMAIADISSGSPNVYYELAILHGLGVPVILLTEGRRQDFYMVQNNVINLASFEIDAIAAGLRGRSGNGHLGQLLRATPQQTKMRSNPISEFLNKIPLVHYSAVSGIATGQYHNFLRWVLERGFFKENPQFKKLILVRPSRVKSIVDDIVKLEEVFGKVVEERDGSPKIKDGRVVKELPTFTHYDRRHPRDRIFIRRIEDHLIDYPTPISSVSISQQYLEAASYYQENSVELEGASFDAESEAYEQNLIETYISLLRRHIETSADCDPRRFEVLTVDEIIKRFAPDKG